MKAKSDVSASDSNLYSRALQFNNVKNANQVPQERVEKTCKIPHRYIIIFNLVNG
jgi:hypothetical protein